MSLLFKVHQEYRKLNFRKNPTCKKCEPKYKTPLGIWHVGSKFSKDKYKLLFVGKSGWSKKDRKWVIGRNGYVDPRKDSVTPKNRFLGNIPQGYDKKVHSFIWRRTKDIVCKLYDLDPLNSVQVSGKVGKESHLPI